MKNKRIKLGIGDGEKITEYGVEKQIGEITMDKMERYLEISYKNQPPIRINFDDEGLKKLIYALNKMKIIQRKNDLN